MTYLHLPDENTTRLNEHERRCAQEAEVQDALEPEIDQHALSLAATYYEEAGLQELYDDAINDNNEFRAGIKQLIANILLDGEKAKPPVDLKEQIEDIGRKYFLNQATREIYWRHQQ